MLEALKRLLSPEYLVVSEPGPMGGLGVLYLALGCLFLAGLVGAAWLLFGPGKGTRRRVQRAWAWFELWICLAGLGTVIGRFLNWPGWSARIWPYSMAALAVLGALVYIFRQANLPGWLIVQLRILAFLPVPASKGAPLWTFAGLLLHLAGIGLLLSSRYHWPLWLAPFLLLALLIPQAPLVARRHLPRVTTLTPLLAAYGVALLWLLYRRLDITIIQWQGLAFPNPMTSLFYLDGIVLAMATYSLLCQLHVTSAELEKRALLWQGAVLGLLALTLAWAGIVYLGKRTHGATASDPYAYAQMGVDLAERGTFLHTYSLFEEVMPLQIAWAPLQPVGYHIPRSEQGDCPSVWATGASVLLAAGYGLLGETGLYVTTPLVALLALAATWFLVQEAFRGRPRSVRYLVGALTIALVATSPEHVDRLLVPMADASAQLFTVLTLFFALRAMHAFENHPGSGGRRILDNGYWLSALAGVCFAWAYWVRHTQLLLALPVVVALVLGVQASAVAPTSNATRPGPRSRYRLLLSSLLIFFGAAALTAIPDIAYRWRVFGSPLATETTELPLMRLEYIGQVAWQMLRDTLAAGEWGYLFPLAVYGAYRLARKRGREALVLGTAFAAILLVHLTYHSLRLRDLISLFPLLDLAVAFGAVALVRQVRRIAADRERGTRLGAAVLPVVAIAWIILSLALARWAMIDNLWKRGWASFGYMRVEHRAAFDQLAELTPQEGIVGASLNAGAVMMYTGRDAIRPYDSWTAEEWEVFLAAMRDAGRPVYLLDDGGLMADFIEEQKSQHRLTPIEELQVPLFYTRDRETGWLYRLEWDP